MSRTATIEPEAATGKAKELLAAVRAKLGLVPNMTKAMAASPAVLEGYLALSGALAHGTLGAKCGERIALAVAEANACGYCLAAHATIGGMVGLGAADVEASRRGRSDDPRTAAALRFAGALLGSRGHVSDADLRAVRGAGFSDGEIGEIVAHVALNVFTNYFNSTAEPEIDFPPAPPLAA